MNECNRKRRYLREWKKREGRIYEGAFGWREDTNGNGEIKSRVYRVEPTT